MFCSILNSFTTKLMLKVNDIYLLGKGNCLNLVPLFGIVSQVSKETSREVWDTPRPAAAGNQSGIPQGY